MRKLVLAVALVAAMPVAANAADAEAGKAIFAKCKACHQINAKSIGPSYMQVSKRYQKNPKAVSALDEKA